MNNNVFAEDLQLRILSFLVRDNNFISRYYDSIKPEFFKIGIYQEVSFIVLDYYKSYKEVIKEDILRTEVDGKKHIYGDDKHKTIIELINSIYETDLTDASYTDDHIKKFLTYNALDIALLESAQVLRNEEDPVKIKTLITDALLISENSSEIGSNFFGDVGVIFDQITNADRRKQIIPTGLVTLDRHIADGGLSKKQTGIILGNAKRGKTIFAVNFGYGALLGGKNVIHYTLEMSEERIFSRYLSRLTGVKRQEFKEKEDKIFQDVVKFYEKHNCNLKIKMFPTNTCTGDSIKAHIAQLDSREDFFPDMIIVDYAELMYFSNREHYRHQLSGAVRSLVQIAQELNIAVWTLAQATRQAANKEHILDTDIAESYDVIRVADLVLGISQTDQERKLNTNSHIGRARVKILDQRDGVSGPEEKFRIIYETYTIVPERSIDPESFQRVQERIMNK